MTLRLDWGSSIPTKAQWILIGVFLVGALALIPQYVQINETTVGYLALAGALIALALKVFTTEETPQK